MGDECYGTYAFGQLAQHRELNVNGCCIEAMIESHSISRHSVSRAHEFGGSPRSCCVTGDNLLWPCALITHPADHALAVLLASALQWPIEV
jgi:hypothetical protein